MTRTRPTSITLATTAVLGLLTGAATADRRKARVKPDPSLPAAVQEMYCLAGEWRGTATLKMGDAQDQLKMNLSCKPASAGHAILCSAEFAGKAFTAHETDLFGYDPGKNQYHWFSVTDQGDTHDHVAEVPTSNTIEFVYSGRADGKALQELIALTISEDGSTLSFRNAIVMGGEAAAKLDGKLVRK